MAAPTTRRVHRYRAVEYKEKAIFLVLGISTISLSFIYLFDATRALRLFKSGMMLVSNLPHPSPFLAFYVLFVYPILWFS
ncbi:MAG: hypothetical protein ACPG4U_15840, partial [Pseudomonadales bacterium]